jgi:hypothetical protein
VKGLTRERHAPIGEDGRVTDRNATPPYATAPRPTAPLALVALAMALLIAPVGVLLGVVARRRILRTGEDGAGTALAAIVVGAVVTALYLLLAVAIVVLFVLVSDPASPLPPGLPTPAAG